MGELSVHLAIVCVLIVVVGVPFTLWWWKKADKWADAEHKRFKPKHDPRERVTIKRDDDSAPPRE